MDVDVAPAVRAALLEAVDREDFGYLPADLSELTESCAAFVGEHVSPSRVFPVADVLAGVAAAVDLFLPAGAPVVVPTPAYSPFFEILPNRVEVPSLDVEAVDAALASGAGGVLLVNPHNPTGRVFTSAELADLAEVVDRHGARVFADEVHAPLTFPGAAHVPYATVAPHHTITVTSASKAWNLAGLKCAQVIASNHEDAAAWRQLPLFTVPGPTPLGVAASIAAYRDSTDWLADLVAHLDRNRRHLADRLPEGIRMDGPEATFLAWLDCSALGLDDPAAFFLQEAKVALSDGGQFGAGHGQFVRLNFATSLDILDRILDAMTEAVRRC
jgi:cystathionine beta-lyase